MAVKFQKYERTETVEFVQVTHENLAALANETGWLVDYSAEPPALLSGYRLQDQDEDRPVRKRRIRVGSWISRAVDHESTRIRRDGTTYYTYNPADPDWHNQGYRLSMSTADAIDQVCANLKGMAPDLSAGNYGDVAKGILTSIRWEERS
ncbi:hypothetical protein [Nesterenkonia rhizosphaerae]|uniref:Uncharacterized protein n=1 Tax=Nesterenkonia rhizosphaerae TaxID=1348272 RepID=A0ABP9FZP6_9MICC